MSNHPGLLDHPNLLGGQFDHVCNTAVLVVTSVRGTVLGRAVLPHHSASATPGDPELATDMVDAPAAR